MPKYIRVGNRAFNLELLLCVEFVPKSDTNRSSVLLLYFSNQDASTQLYGNEAEQVWHLISHGALNVTPSETKQEESVAPW